MGSPRLRLQQPAAQAYAASRVPAHRSRGTLCARGRALHQTTREMPLRLLHATPTVTALVCCRLCLCGDLRAGGLLVMQDMKRSARGTCARRPTGRRMMERRSREPTKATHTVVMMMNIVLYPSSMCTCATLFSTSWLSPTLGKWYLMPRLVTLSSGRIVFRTGAGEQYLRPRLVTLSRGG